MITLEQLKAAMPHASDKNRELMLPSINDGMAKFDINTKQRQAMFLAQIAHESGNLHYVEELASGSAYENRKDLGNLEKEALDAAHAKGTTTGKFFRGHGLIQITGFYNHKKCGEALKIDSVNNPELLASARYAAMSAAWFWGTHGCNELADSGDFKAVTRRINGGYNGLADRITHYEHAKKALGI
jgi:putative chitinase